jgi:HSP20 family protein
MAIERWVPRWARELDEELSQAFGQHSAYWQRPIEREWAPSIDVVERPEDVLVEVDLPGVDRKSLDVTVENGLLTIKAERKATAAPEQSTCHCYERPRGTFYRAIQLPEEALSEKVEATYEDGVLRIVLSKRPEAKPRKIAVATSNGAAPSSPAES